MKSDQVVLGQIETAMGSFGAAVSATGLGRLTFPDEPFEECEAWAARWYPDAERIHADALFDQVKAELVAYMEGRLQQFDVPVDLHGTPFQQEVWQALLAIPYGEVRTYGEVARAIERPKAVRAVGAACGANPVPLVVPCHRVLGSNGKLTGYAGSLPVKQRLLELEGARLA